MCNYRRTDGSPCPEPAHTDSRDGLCTFHDLEIWREKPDLVREEFMKRVKAGQRDFEGYNLPGVDLREFTFREDVRFDKATFHKDCHFSKAEFKGRASFVGAKFEEAYFLGAEFRGVASFSKAKFEEANFIGAKFEFEGADFAEAEFKEANFSWARFKGANFLRAKFERANFSWAEFEGAHFIEAEFGRANFIGAEFGEANFSWAKFEGTYFLGAEFKGPADFSWSAFKGEADFSGANFQGEATFYRTTMEEGSFSEARFRAVSFLYARIAQPSFAKVTWPEGHLLTEEAVARQKRGDERAERFERASMDYHNVAQWLRREGLTEEAGEFYLRKMACKRREYGTLWRLRLGELFRTSSAEEEGEQGEEEPVRPTFWRAFSRWVLYSLLDAGCGFGERPSRILWLSGGLLSIFTELMWFWGMEHGPIPTLEGLKEALKVVLASFTSLGLEGAALTPFGEWLSVVASYAGYLLLILFLFLFIRKAARE